MYVFKDIWVPTNVLKSISIGQVSLNNFFQYFSADVGEKKVITASSMVWSSKMFSISVSRFTQRSQLNPLGSLSKSSIWILHINSICNTKAAFGKFCPKSIKRKPYIYQFWIFFQALHFFPDLVPTSKYSRL